MIRARRIIALTLVMVFMVTMMTAFLSSASFDPKSIKNDVVSKAKNATNEETKMFSLGGKVLYGIKLVGFILSILLIVWFGIQWMAASPQARAGLKEKAWNYVIGAALLFGSGYIAQWIYSIVNKGIGG